MTCYQHEREHWTIGRCRNGEMIMSLFSVMLSLRFLRNIHVEVLNGQLEV